MVTMFRRRSLCVLAATAIVLAGCGTSDGDTDGTMPPVTPVPTIAGVGNVPAVPSAVREPIVVVRPPVNQDGTEAQLIGETVEGNRVLMIGDSILASTSARYGDHMCSAVVPLGWEVAVEAEPSRFIEFGNQVLDDVLPDDPEANPDDDWDAAVVFLGSNYGGDAEDYEAELVEILDRLAPRPVVLFTVSEYRPNYVEVNEVVNRLGSERDNVVVLDWKSISEAAGVLSSDRLHPTDTGRRVLAESVAAAHGPVVGEGDCLRPSFRDDSAIRGDTTTVLGRPSTGSGSSGSGSAATTTTVRPPTSVTTTTLPGSSGGGGTATSTTTPSSGGTTTSSPATTAPATTAPATSAPATTVAPTPTSAPTTPPPTPPAPLEPTP
jgi:hypothetical protein